MHDVLDLNHVDRRCDNDVTQSVPVIQPLRDRSSFVLRARDPTPPRMWGPIAACIYDHWIAALQVATSMHIAYLGSPDRCEADHSVVLNGYLWDIMSRGGCVVSIRQGLRWDEYGDCHMSYHQKSFESCVDAVLILFNIQTESGCSDWIQCLERWKKLSVFFRETCTSWQLT
jgi:hypothetical protein